MNAAFRNVLALSIVLMPLASFAAEISEPEAKRIEGAISSSLPAAMRKAGVVTVAPSTDHFNVTLDFAGMLAKGVAPWAVKEVTPIVHALTPDVDGLWDFSTQGSFRLGTELLAANRTSAFQLSVGEIKDKGKFDPRIPFLREADVSLKDVTTTMRSSQDTIKAGIKDFSARIRSADVKAGVVDIVSDYSGSGLSQTFGTFPNPEVKISGEKLEGQQNFESVDLIGIKKLIAFSRRSTPRIKGYLSDADHTAIAAIVKAHKPFVAKAGENTTIGNVSIASGGKKFLIERLGYHWSIEDIANDGFVVFGATFQKPSITPGFWPAGVEKAMPQEARINVRYSGFKLSAVWEALANLESQPLPDYGRLMLPDGRLKYDFSDTFVRSEHYDFSLIGSVFQYPGSRDRFEGDVTVTAKNFETTVKFLQDSSRTVPQLGQAAFVALMAKGLGKIESDGSTVWQIKFDTKGKITINGQPLPV